MKTAVHKGFFSLRPMLKIPAENLFPAVLVSLSACCDKLGKLVPDPEKLWMQNLVGKNNKTMVISNLFSSFRSEKPEVIFIIYLL